MDRFVKPIACIKNGGYEMRIYRSGKEEIWTFEEVIEFMKSKNAVFNPTLCLDVLENYPFKNELLSNHKIIFAIDSDGTSCGVKNLMNETFGKLDEFDKKTVSNGESFMLLTML